MKYLKNSIPDPSKTHTKNGWSWSHDLWPGIPGLWSRSRDCDPWSHIPGYDPVLLIAWLTISKNSWYTKTVSFREEYERSKIITRGPIEQSFECCFAISYSKGFNESSVWTPPFSGKPGYKKHFSLILYTSGEFLANSLKITHLNLLLITEKAFQLMWLVEPGLWFSFTIHWIILCTQV